MIFLNKLKVIQSKLRHTDDIKSMSEYVKCGGFWDEECLVNFYKTNNLNKSSPIIQITKFEDGEDYIHDGHHRCVATWLGNRKYLRDDEYHISEWKYTDYTEINLTSNWITAFDPRTHTRIANFSKFKKKAILNLNNIKEWIKDHLDDFREIRKINHLYELAEIYKY